MGTRSEAIELNGRLREEGEQEDEIVARPTRRNLNMNHYANKKSAAESMLDIALLMANASQLKAVIEQGPSFSFYVPLITLITISLIFQVVVGVLLIFIVKYDLNNPAKHTKLDNLENAATGLVFIIVVVNVFITAFGVQKPADGSTRV
ncbi:ninjurin-1 [Dendropsophus ebraccatus]|uniref:ninjurin-1 n=1 Tax=Dendropsophus ebraccatus TaxID=150705 RepID=UPI003831222E